MAEVTFPTELGGNGLTYNNASFANGGHRVNFLPVLGQTVLMALASKNFATDSANYAQAAIDAVLQLQESNPVNPAVSGQFYSTYAQAFADRLNLVDGQVIFIISDENTNNLGAYYLASGTPVTTLVFIKNTEYYISPNPTEVTSQSFQDLFSRILVELGFLSQLPPSIDIGAEGPNVSRLPLGKTSIIFAASDETSDLVVKTAATTLRAPYGIVLSEVRASVTTAPTGAPIVVDILKNGVSILGTQITIDIGEKSSFTAATLPVITDAVLSSDDEISINIINVGSAVAGKGLKVTLIGDLEDSIGVPIGYAPFHVPAYFPGIAPANASFLRIPVALNLSFPADFFGSYATASAAATASKTFTVRKIVGATVTVIGTFTFAIGATTATFVTTGNAIQNLVPGDVLSIIGPATPDATLADVGVTLAGRR